MPSIYCCLNKIFKSFDFFPSSKFLRYNGETDYTTATGGFVSIGVLVIILFLFSNQGLRTLRRQIITSSVQSSSQIIPTQFNVTTGSQGNFMFAVTIPYINLTQIPRLFDIYLMQQLVLGGTLVNPQNYQRLQACTQQHFNHSSQMIQEYYAQNLTNGLCPYVGTPLTVEGKLQGTHRQFSIYIQRCNPNSSPDCATDLDYNFYQSLFSHFQLNIHFVNVIINPGNQNYTTYYLDDRNSFYFSSSLGIEAFAYISEDSITTDASIMPWEDFQTENVTAIIKDLRASYFLLNGQKAFARVRFLKSSNYQIYTRTFNKVDAYFSYVGGLVGTIIGFFFLMGPYTEKAFEISLARKLMVDEDNKDLSSRNYNIGYYFLATIKDWASIFKINFSWPMTQKYVNFGSQVSMQIDITYIIRKLEFLDASITKIMQKHQIEALCLRQKPTLQQAKYVRRQHFALQIMKETDLHGGGTEQTKQDMKITNNKMKYVQQVQKSDKLKQKQDPGQDLSALEFSQREGEVKKYQQSVNKVRNNVNKKRANKRILEEIHPDLAMQITQEKMCQQIDYQYIVIEESIVSGKKNAKNSQSNMNLKKIVIAPKE